MAGSNPVFSKVDREIQSGYAGFGQQPQAGGAGQTAAYGVQDSMSQQQLENMYNGPTAGPRETGRVTYDDVIMKTLGLFVLVVAFAGGAWVLTAGNPGLITPIWIAGMLVGLVVGLAIAFMKTVSVPLIVLYAAVQGAFLGAFSMVMEASYPGIVVTAVVATLCTFAGMFIGYKANIIRVSNRSRRVFGMMLIGYLLFSLVNVIALLFGWTSGWGFGGTGPLGIAISVLGVGLASYSLAVDFDSIQKAVSAGLPEKYSWLLAHGLIVSLIWLYLEILRLLGRLRG